MCLQAIADSGGIDPPSNRRGLIRTFAVRLQNHWAISNKSMESKYPDDTLRMCGMIMYLYYAFYNFGAMWGDSVWF